MQYLILLNLIHHIFGFLLVFWSLKCTIMVLFSKQLYKDSSKFSPIIIIYFVFLFIYSISSLLNYTFLIAFWRPDGNIYNSFLLFWFGLLPFILGYTITVIEIFLCLDRCFSIIFPFKYISRHRNFFAYANVIAIFCVVGIFLFVCGILKAIPTEITTKCSTFGCLLGVSPPQKYVTELKLPIIITNFFGGILLFCLNKFLIKSINADNKRITITVIIVILSTTFFEIVPTWFSLILYRIFGKYLNEIIGPYAFTATALNTTICVTIYSKACLKTFIRKPSTNFMAVVPIRNVGLRALADVTPLPSLTTK